MDKVSTLALGYTQMFLLYLSKFQLSNCHGCFWMSELCKHRGISALVNNSNGKNISKSSCLH